MSEPRSKESDILKTIMDGLAAMRIWRVRMNTGGMFGSHKGKRWAVRFGRKGMADIMAWDKRNAGHVWWIECKRPGETQTPDQFAFQKEVEEADMKYLLAHSWEDVLEVLK